eukprot:TRINITY_DN12221_c0_g1::TRINITY_DN12221_c0_g1_i1::g.13031::m.13031 TRINITY_DN12221_c0_g1::TRINITY_DN12221_c0_g1_i1::g.13031  ORF type:complete len:240 (+),score=21.33,sp/Q5BJW3/TX261_RAT/37.93/1e-31,Erv26/PF04148.8/3.7e-51,GATA/PF00320.22/0.4 TRINITY_DN12221_c0_g1_i1:63-722(+)
MELALPSFFTILVYISAYFILVFIALCLACGLYYLAELVEEYTSLTKKIIRYTILTQFVIHFLLWVWEGFPLVNVAIGAISHFFYFQLLKTFPFFEWKSWRFLCSVVMVVANHLSWFHFFMYDDTRYYTHRTATLVSFFVSCVWLIPFVFFLSLSANEQVLPMTPGQGGLYAARSQDEPFVSDHKPAKRTNYLLGMFGWLKEKKDAILPAVLPQVAKSI